MLDGAPDGGYKGGMKRFHWWSALLMLAAVPPGLWYGWEEWREGSQDEPIRVAAERYGIDPALVKAIVWQESRFNPAARGLAGELGLMQLQEIAAGEWADEERVAGYAHEHCLDPGTNTLSGTFYLAKLMRRYTKTDNPVPYALADYNAGRGNVVKWIHGEAATNSAVFIEQIGFPSTRTYVQNVMERYEKYRQTFR
jgi:soluble lytic murein transglycosylase